MCFPLRRVFGIIHSVLKRFDIRRCLSHEAGAFAQFVKYGVVGVMATCVQTGVFYALAATCLRCLGPDDWAVAAVAPVCAAEGDWSLMLRPLTDEDICLVFVVTDAQNLDHASEPLLVGAPQ